MKKYKTGLVLTGGGTRGFAHLGAIQALYEKGIKPDVISGVSAGAIAGAFTASGKSPEEIFKLFKKNWAIQYTKLKLPVDGLLRLDGLKNIISKNITAKNIEDLETPLFIGISNINKGIIEYRNKGPLDVTVLASSSIPILFAPVKIGRYSYVDGGLMNNIPIEPIVDQCKELIVSNISPINPKANVNNLIQIATRTFYMSVNAHLPEVMRRASIYIEPKEINKYDMLLRTHADELFELGYVAAKKAISLKLAN